MIHRKVRTLLFAFCSVSSLAIAQETTSLRPGQPVEREIVGGETHTYSIALTAGQFMRVVVEQKGIDVGVALIAPDGKQIAEGDISTGAFGQEPLSHEATVGGDYRIVVRPIVASAPRGTNQVLLEVKAAATAPDKQRLAAERLLAEVARLSQQGGVSVAQTIEKAQQALTLWLELGDRYWEARTRHLIGYSYASGSKYEQAIQSYEQALAIQREIKNRPGEGAALGGLGFAYSSLSRYEKAIEYHEQALAIHREVNNRAGEGNTLDNLGSAYRLLSRYEKAIEYHEQALAIHRRDRNRAGEGTTLNNLGVVYRSVGRHEKAIEYNEQALAIHREVKNRAGEAGALGNLGNAHNSLSRYEKAIGYYEQALAINREVKNRAGEGGQLGNLGSAYFFLSRYDKAIEYFEQALAISREVKNRAAEGGTLGNLGGTYSLLSRYDKAIEYYEQALAIGREIKNRAGEENALNNLGTAYKSLGRYEKAIEYHEQALAIHREVKNRAGEGSPLHNLGIAYRALGRYEKAIEYYDQALAIFREAKNRAAEGAALSNLGNAYEALARYEKAIEYHEQALAISREIKNRAGEGNALGSLGAAYSSLSRYEKAIEYHEQALVIHREVKNRAGEGDALHNLGDVHNALGRYDKAVESFEQALAIRREVQDRLGEALSLQAFARVERSRGNLAQSRALIEQSLQIVEASRSEIYNPQSRASYFASAQTSHEFYIDLLMRQHKVEPAKGLDALAVEASERARARGLLELLTEASTNIRQGVDAGLLDRERTLSRQLNAKATRQIQLLSQPHTPEQARALQLELSQLETDYERAQAAIRKNSPHYAALTQPQPSSLAEIQQQLDAETLLLEYSLGYERSYLWAITNNSISSYELPKEEQLKQTVTQVLDLLTARTRRQRGETPSEKQNRIAQAEAQLPEAARQLSRILLGPVAAQLGNKRLVIVADGALQYIPFAMLPEPVGSRQKAEGSTKPSPVVSKNERVRNRQSAIGNHQCRSSSTTKL